MIITLTRSGGFTGIPMKKTIDTKTLPPEKAKEIEDLVAKADLAQGKPHLACRQEGGIAPTKNSQPDRFTYTITIQHDTDIRSLPIQEESGDQVMQELLRAIQGV